MRIDSRLSRVLHALLHLNDMARPATSDDLGKMLNANPALVRRLMGGLRDAGFVTSTKGHGGGWVLARPLSEISLLQVYEALGAPTLFALGPANKVPTCLLERSANDTLGRAMDHARHVFEAQLSGVTLEDLARDFETQTRGTSAAGRLT